MAKDYSKNPYLPKGWTIENCKFENRKALTEAFSDPRYATDADFRELAGAMASNGFQEDEGKETTQTSTVVSGRDLNRAMADKAGARRLEDEAIFREKTQALFADLRYETSPSYRREVENWLRENNDVIDQHMPKGALIDRTAQNRKAFRVTIGQTVSEFDAIKQSLRDQQAAKDAADLKEKHERLDRGESTDTFDLGGQRV